MVQSLYPEGSPRQIVFASSDERGKDQQSKSSSDCCSSPSPNTTPTSLSGFSLEPAALSLATIECHCLWYVNGIGYDLTPYLSLHPGGSIMLNSAQGTDIQLAMMVHHRLTLVTNTVAIKMIEKYKVDNKKYTIIHPSKTCVCNTNQTPEFDTSIMTDETSFHNQLTMRVKEWIKKNSYDPYLKANWKDHIALISLWIVQLSLVYGWICTGSHVLGFLSSLVWIALGFMGMHSASHFGYSRIPLVNDVIGWLWCCWGGWFYPLWMRHHVISHHLFTGVYRADVDVNHFHPVGRKHPKARRGLFGRYQHILLPIFAGIFLGQYVGQVIVYIRSMLTGRLFGSEMAGHAWTCKKDTIVTGIIASISAFVQICTVSYMISMYGFYHTIITVIIFGIGLNFGYWSLVAPNHDTEAAHLDDDIDAHLHDWSIQQLSHSSDFLVPSWCSYLMGGMNYQIEHHLFPCVHPKYYPEIHQILNQLCKEKDVKHNIYTSWQKAIASHIRFLKKVR